MAHRIPTIVLTEQPWHGLVHPSRAPMPVPAEVAEDLLWRVPERPRDYVREQLGDELVLTKDDLKGFGYGGENW